MNLWPQFLTSLYAIIIWLFLEMVVQDVGKCGRQLVSSIVQSISRFWQRFLVQFYDLFHDSTIGSKQFPTYLSILPLIFSSCPTYFMIVPLFSFNFQPISVKMYHRITYIYICMHICIYSMYRNKYMYIHTWFYRVHLCMLYYMYIRICIKKQKNIFCF